MKPDYRGAWVALYRKTVNSDSLLSLSCAERSVFLQSFFLAAGIEYDFSYHGRTYHLLPGQFVITLDDFAKRCGHGCSVKIVRRTLDKLRVRLTWADGRVSQRADAPHLVTFTNWTSYQFGGDSRADERADTRVGLGQEECPQSLSGIDGFSSKNEDITSDITKEKVPVPRTPKTRTAKIAFDKQTGQFLGLSEDLQSKLSATYPGVDLPQVIREAQLWAVDNRRSDYWGSLKAFCEHSLKGGVNGNNQRRGYRPSIEDAVFTGEDFISDPHS